MSVYKEGKAAQWAEPAALQWRLHRGQDQLGQRFLKFSSKATTYPDKVWH